MLTAVASGFVLAVLAPFLVSWLRRASGWVLALYPASVAAFLINAIPEIMAGSPPTESLAWVPSLGITLSFRLDGLSLLLALLISGIGTLVVIYTGGYLGEHPRLGRFFAFLLAFMASMLGVVLADNLMLLFVFWELTSLTSYFLIGFDSEQENSRKAALQALLVTGLGGLILLAGLLLLGTVGGTFEISELLSRREILEQDARMGWILVLILIGAFTKSAQFPFHFWLPNAMAAPTPASAYLHSSTMVKVGIYLLARLHVLFEGSPVWFGAVTTIGAITMLAGAYLAIKETYYKRVLAYSTMSVLGLLTMLLGMGGQLAVEAAMVFLIAHAFYKAGLFLVAGVVDHETGVRDLKQLGGLARAMPLVAGSAALLALSMAGVIGTFGFLAKELLFEASLHHPSQVLLTAASLTAGLLMVTVACLAGWGPFFGPRREYSKHPHNGPASLWLGPLVLAVLGLATGLKPELLSGSIVSPAVSAVLGETAAVSLKVWHGFNTALLLDGIALAGGVILFLLIAPVREGLTKWDVTGNIGPARWYDAGLAGVLRLAAWQTRVLQNGYLRIYLITIVLTTVFLVGGVTLFSRSLPLNIFSVTDVKFHEIGLAAVILVAVGMVVHVNSRLAAVAALGIVGYGVGILYVMFGAPDLAITQFVIETLTVILFVLVFYRLEGYKFASTPITRLRDAVISLSAGALMTVLVLLSGSSEWFPTISEYYGANSVTAAHGYNIVNVILVDFRAIDTLGEITVLSIAGIGVFALLKLRPPREEDQT